MEIYFQLVRDGEALKKACDELKSAPFLGFDVETTELDPYRGELRLVQLSDGKNTKVIDLRSFGSGQWTVDSGQPLRDNTELAPLRDLLSSTRQTKIAHNAKFDTKWVRHHLGVEVGGCLRHVFGEHFDRGWRKRAAARTGRCRAILFAANFGQDRAGQ